MYRCGNAIEKRYTLRQTLKDNYISKRENKFVSFSKWKDVYNTDLVNMFDIITKVYDSRYEHNTRWEELFEKFCLLIFKKSSKYIMQSKET